MYLKLIVLKNDLDEIMDYARKNLTSIEQYAEMVNEKYNDQVVVYKRGPAFLDELSKLK